MINKIDPLAVLGRLLKLIMPFKWWVILAALLGFATVGSSIGLMATSAYIIAKAALHPSIAVLQVSIVGVRFFGISRGLFRYLERYVSHRVTFKLLAQLRVWFYQAVEPLAPARLMQYRSGDLLSRIAADIESLEHFYVRVIAPPVTAGLVFLLIWVFMRAYDHWLAMATLAFLLAGGVALPLVTRRLSRGIGQKLVDARASLNATQIDSIQGAADLIIAGAEPRQQNLVDNLSQKLTTLQNRESHISGLHSAASGLLVNWSTLAILLIAIPLVRSGQLDGVYLAVLTLAGLAAFEAVQPLPEAWQHLESSLAAARRLFGIVDAQPAVTAPPNNIALPPPTGCHLEIDNLTFHYDPTEPATLQNISLSLPPGKKIAVVGPSGAGKSTLINLLLRFWEYHHGEILLNGADLRRYHPEDVRQIISVVSQHTHLFNGAVRDNLLMARPNASEADMIAACKQARLHPFVQSLPQGYDTWIGEQGLKLSGGERQRLSIARALLKNAPILILDEATANLDWLTEQAILQTLQAVTVNHSVLMITHRLAGLHSMDEIITLENGRITERGTHNQLMQANGLYRQLWNLQHRQKD